MSTNSREHGHTPSPPSHGSGHLLDVCTSLYTNHTALLLLHKTNVTITSVNLNHFRLLRVVGRGAFGKVRIVERKDTSLSFALKYIRKDEGMLHHDHCGRGTAATVHTVC